MDRKLALIKKLESTLEIIKNEPSKHKFKRRITKNLLTFLNKVEVHGPSRDKNFFKDLGWALFEIIINLL